MPKVSVIIASYNHEKFVGKAIQSILDQTFQDFEILIGDDASPDNSVEVIKSIEDPRIKLYEFENNREEHMRNYCLERAKGEYIAIQNSDDEFHEEKLAKQVEYLDEHPEAGAVFTKIELIDEKSKPFTDKSHAFYGVFTDENRSRHKWLNYFFLSGNCLCHPSVLMRKKLMDRGGRYNPLLGLVSDLDMWVKIALQSEIHIIMENLFRMRVLSGDKNASAVTVGNKNRSLIEYSRVMMNYTSKLALNQLHEIFPDIEDKVFKKPDYVQKYELANLAYEYRGPVQQLFGLQLWYELLNDVRTRRKLEKYYDRKLCGDFIKATGSSEIIQKLAAA